MKQLIRIRKSTKTGAKVVSARDLYEFLEVRKDFSTWIKKLIDKYCFIENVDYACLYYDKKGDKIELPKNGELMGVGVQGVYRIEYALKIDTAKEISMVQNNEKGRQARQYFIEVEKMYQAGRVLSSKSITVTGALLESVQILDQQAKTLVDHEKRLTGIEKIHETARQELKALPGATVDVPEKTTRMSINQAIRSISYRDATDPQNLWRHLYKEYSIRYHINLRIRAQNEGISMLDWIETNNKMDELYALLLSLYHF
jgi:anti-repressor protein